MSFSLALPVFVFVLAVIAVLVLKSAVKILREYERAVVFTFGRFGGVRGPGLVLLIPFIQEVVRVDLRIQVIEIPSQDVISHDNVSMKVDAVLYFNVTDPERAIIKVQSYLPATNMLAQTTLRAVLGQHELDEMLSERKKMSEDIQGILDAQTETWGIKVINVEIRTVELTDNMVRAIAKQAEAERDRGRKSFTRRLSFRRRKLWSTQRRFCPAFRLPCSFDICRPSPRSGPNRIRRSSSRCPSISSSRSSILSISRGRRARRTVTREP
jgi:regulator of protease activity HflC (stomatin/prohibitin superfamily)